MSRAPFIGADDLDRLMAAEGHVVVLDASLHLHPPRFDGDFRAESGRSLWEAARIPGALHVGVDTDLSVPGATHFHHPPPQVLADTLAEFGIGPQTQVVVYDATGGLWAARAWYLLRWIGLQVRVLDGGLSSWRTAGLPLEAGEAGHRHPRAVPRWTAQPASKAWIDKAELLTRQDTDGNLVCGLSEASFRGAEPTRYTRRGHIRGSLHVAARALFDEHGLIRPAVEVTARYRDAGADLTRELLLYCGGGISAAANALALDSIGIRHVRIYDGSLEEWSADPKLPLIVGC